MSIENKLLKILKVSILAATILSIVAIVVSCFIDFRKLDNYILTACLTALFLLSRRYKVKYFDKLAIIGALISIIKLSQITCWC